MSHPLQPLWFHRSDDEKNKFWNSPLMKFSEAPFEFTPFKPKHPLSKVNLLVTCFTLLSCLLWWWRWYVPPKRRLIFNRVYGIPSQNMESSLDLFFSLNMRRQISCPYKATSKSYSQEVDVVNTAEGSGRMKCDQGLYDPGVRHYAIWAVWLVNTCK
jgi:hypothetical protein